MRWNYTVFHNKLIITIKSKDSKYEFEWWNFAFFVCSSTNNHLSSLQVYFMTHLKGPSRTHWTKLMNTYDTHWCISINNLQKHVFTWKYILHFRTFYITALNFKAADRPVLSPCHSFHHCVFWGWVKKTHWDEDTTHAFKVFFVLKTWKLKSYVAAFHGKYT